MQPTNSYDNIRLDRTGLESLVSKYLPLTVFERDQKTYPNPFVINRLGLSVLRTCPCVVGRYSLFTSDPFVSG